MAAVNPATPSPEASPEISPGDRLGFTLFLAVALHAALILGVTFTYVTGKPSIHTMEVTLAQQRSGNRPDKPDFLAQINQLGSGTLEEKAPMTAPTGAGFQEADQKLPQEQALKTTEQKQTVITTTANPENRAVLDTEHAGAQPPDTELADDRTLRTRALEIVRLEARLDRQRQIYAKRPRIKRLTSLMTASSADAFYLNSWRRKVEGIGNLNYPEQARRNKLYGSLRLMVAILPDGSLKEIELLESSGHQILDDAAIRIVRLAAPFAPFPDELRQTTDVLEIIRTWQFRKNSSLRSY